MRVTRRALHAAFSSSSASASASGPLFLGLDASTQGLKATLVDARLRPVPLRAPAAVNYLADLPSLWPAGAKEPVLRGPRGAAGQPRQGGQEARIRTPPPHHQEVSALRRRAVAPLNQGGGRRSTRRRSHTAMSSPATRARCCIERCRDGTRRAWTERVSAPREQTTCSSFQDELGRSHCGVEEPRETKEAERCASASPPRASSHQHGVIF